MNRTHLFLIVKSGAPPDESQSPALSITYKNSMVSQIALISKGYFSLVPGLVSFFIDGMSPFKKVLLSYSVTKCTVKGIPWLRYISKICIFYRT